MDRYSQDLNYTAESLLLVKASLERHRRTNTQEDNSAGSETDTIRWAACKYFTVHVGKEQIEAYIQTWEIPSSWLYSLDFLYSTEEEHYTIYHYRARFSTTTARKPIQGTASVYFAVEVSRNKPQTIPVEVHFIVESNRLIHTPGKSRFREKWLADVIESKALLRSMVNL
ncbi:A-kinase anchor protein 14 [Leuresthes tenuis]|uniref:A-kinase anchor protein 14 n=1 Tax=Leuresthes tenuis TaxID=355514 RepID=UPI003B5027C4